MKNIIKSLIVIAGALVAFSSCTGKFEEMNISPNSPSANTVDPKFQFLYAVSRSIPYRNTFQGQEQVTITTFAEYDANSTQTNSDLSIKEGNLSSTWNIAYNALTNLNSIIRNCKDSDLNSNVAYMAMIWKVQVMLRMTDYIGNIPYTEAANEEGTLPKYDTQKEIYYAMFDELKEAVSKLDASKPNVGSYDLLYSGDVTKWKKFANSLRLRMGVRILDVDPAKGKEEIASAIAAGVFTSRDEEAALTMGDESNSDYSQNPFYYGRNSSHSTLHMSLAYYNLVANYGGIAWPTAADQAKNANIPDCNLTPAEGGYPEKVDPRAVIQWEVVGSTSVTDAQWTGWFRGSEPGHCTDATLSGEMDNGDNAQNYASFGKWFRQTATKPWMIMKYAEVCFLKAIAVEKGAYTGDAKTFYEDGIKADMAYYGVPDDVVASYLASTDKNLNGTSVAYSDNSGDCNTALDKIISQKYIAHFPEGSYEAWSDHRQYHKPTFVVFANVNANFKRTAADVENNTPNAYIKRGYYPTDEQTTNTENWKAAVAALGGDDNSQINVWWDVD